MRRTFIGVYEMNVQRFSFLLGHSFFDPLWWPRLFGGPNDCCAGTPNSPDRTLTEVAELHIVPLVLTANTVMVCFPGHSDGN
jgi:hypothetical protein